MKTKSKITQKKFDTVSTFRAIKEKISSELVDKSPEQIAAYLKENSLKFKKLQ